MSITTADYRRARHLTDNAAELLAAALRTETRGRPGLHPRVLLTGMALAIDTRGSATITDIHTTLTRDLPRKLQWDLGVLTGTKNKPRQLSAAQLYKMTSKISAKLDYTHARAPHLDDDERATRREQVATLVTTMLATTLPPRPEGSADYALDGTGIWAFERAPRKLPTTAEADIAAANTATDAVLMTAPQHTTDDGTEDGNEDGACAGGKGDKGPSDAAFGAKTHKTGRTETFYGYDCEALIRVPNTGDRSRSEPNLVEQLVVLPASTHITEPCLELIDRILKGGQAVKALLVDRHYSYKSYDDWLQQLLERGISQVADAHANDQGYRDWEGMLVAAGCFHCPLVPQRLAVIPSLGPEATKEERAAFDAAITERQAYACQVVERLGAHGRMRIRCAARNGSVACTRYAPGYAAALAAGLPVVSPDPDDPTPKMCTQDTVTVRVDTPERKAAMKLNQQHYWGSREWRRSYARRTYIEGWFGVLKSKSATKCQRGSHQFRGLALVTVVLAVAAAVTNMRNLRSWHTETGNGDPNHPLLLPDGPFFGFAELDAAGAAAIDAECAPRHQAATDADGQAA